MIWMLYTRTLLTPGLSGDYARVGYIAGSSYRVPTNYGLPFKHLENHEYAGQEIDVLTLGDSFSNSCGKTDEFYQDYIATYQRVTVLNIPQIYKKDSIDSLIRLINNGYLDLVRPKVVILQMAERFIGNFFSTSYDFQATEPLESTLEYFRKPQQFYKSPKVEFLNPGNFKFVLYSLLYHVKDNAFFSKVYMRELTKPLFSVKNDKKLIFSHEEFDHLSRENPETIERLNQTLNQLAKMLKKKGIQLYFMPVVGKYNLYSDFLVENPYPKSRFFEILRTLEKEYRLIDTKALLLEELQKGEKDIFYADDSHWSRKAPEKIFKTVQL